jgi:uncharacterized membrane protein YdjX (TVP38/TMEM64 family)
VTGISVLLYETGMVHYFLSKKRLLGLLESLDAMGRPVAILGLILFQAAQVVFAPIPGEVTGLAGGFFLGPLGGVICSTIGLTIGSYMAFVLGRAFGRPLVERFVPKSIMDRFDYLLHHKGAYIVFLLFLIPGFPKDTLCYFLGLGHLTAVEFLVIGGTGRLFGTILLTLGGDFIRHHEYVKFSILAGAALVLVLVAMAFRDKLERLFRLWHIRDYRRKRSQRPSSRTGQGDQRSSAPSSSP